MAHPESIVGQVLLGLPPPDLGFIALLLEMALLFLRRRAWPCGRPAALDARLTSMTDQ